MIKKLISIQFIVLPFLAAGQVFSSDPLTGKPYVVRANDDVRGSVYLFEDWKPANVTDKAGTTFLNVMVRFDAYMNKFFYNHGDTAYEFVTDIREVELFPFVAGDTTTHMVFKKGFKLNDKTGPNKFVQVLTEGKVTAVKELYKSVEESTEYNVPGKIKTFADRSAYYFIKDGAVVSQKPGTKLLEELLKDKWGEVQVYAKQNSLNPKNENDCMRIIRYYNTL